MTASSGDPVELLAEADALLATGDRLDQGATTARFMDVLAALETATPGGAPLHRQIDVVRRWLTIMRNEAEHARFGGTAHLREYFAAQMRLLRAAVVDYLEARPR